MRRYILKHEGKKLFDGANRAAMLATAKELPGFVVVYDSLKKDNIYSHVPLSRLVPKK